MKTAHDLVAAAKARIHEVPLTEADDAIRAADVLVDVRELDEFHASHIPGALHASRGTLEFKFSNNPELQSRDLQVL
ncbi:MAG: sulfurtransferase, partial [Burkholderiaceae bacterium]|nr:sulfurtransferase [Burkholderiaceae bacterium]